MSTMSELHIRTQDELDYIAEVDCQNHLAEVAYDNMQAAMESANPCDTQPLWLLHIRAFGADSLHALAYRFNCHSWIAKSLHNLAYKVDYCPF